MKSFMVTKLNVLLFAMIFLFSCTEEPPLPDFKSIPGRYSPRVALDWMDVTTEMAKSMQFSPIASARLFSYTSLALYESQVPEIADAQSMFTYFSDKTISIDPKSNFYGPATANTAVAEILRKFSPDAANLKTIDSLEAFYNTFFKNNKTDIDKLGASTTYGKQLANDIFEWSKGDNALSPCAAYTPPVGPGLWEPTPPAFLPAVLPCLGNARTFNKDIKSLAQAGTPLAYSTETSSEYYKNANEVFQYKTKLTGKDSLLINSWLDFQPKNYNTVSHVNKLQTGILRSRSADLSEAAAQYAKLNIAMYDAIITTAAAKYKYNIQRPITYIRNVMGQNSWNSYIPLAPLPPIPTLPFPSYPSYMGTVISAGTAMLESYHGSSYQVVDATQESLYGKFNYKNLQAFADSAIEQRIMTGQNFRFSMDASRKSGKIIADAVKKLPFKDK